MRAEAARPKAFCVAPRMMAFIYRCFRLALASPMTATPSERAAAMPVDTPGVPPLLKMAYVLCHVQASEERALSHIKACIGKPKPT